MALPVNVIIKNICACQTSSLRPRPHLVRRICLLDRLPVCRVLPRRSTGFMCAAQTVSDARVVRVMAVDSRCGIRTTMAITIAAHIHRQACVRLDDLVAAVPQGSRERLGAVSVRTSLTMETNEQTMK